ncbi:hypothetical protein Mapa_015605 [Marchantia paleacea]|nr:hypothetical protein Mapa_015605 [Marchantia paleacea]
MTRLRPHSHGHAEPISQDLRARYSVRWSEPEHVLARRRLEVSSPKAPLKFAAVSGVQSPENSQQHQQLSSTRRFDSPLKIL